MTYKRLASCGEALLNYAEALEELEEQVEYARAADKVDNQEDVGEISKEIYNVRNALDSSSLFASEGSPLHEVHPKEQLSGHEKKLWLESEMKVYEKMLEEDFIESTEDIDVEPSEFFKYAFEELEEKEDELISEYRELMS